MKKIGIVTIVDYNNYGNRLQNYALQEFLKSFGYEVVTLTKLPSSTSVKITKNKLNIKKMLKKIKKIKKLNKNLLFTDIKKIKKQKYNNFLSFTYKYIKEADFSEMTEKDKQKFSYFISGSDQIWNPHFREGNENDFLQFCSFEKRLTYAPSFGVSEIPEEYANDYKTWLNGFKNISVREQSGQKIIFNLTNKNAQVLLDPTMMLNKNEWKKIFNNSVYIPKNKYILTYFLGEIPKEAKLLIKEFKQKGYTIVNLSDISHKKYFSIDPSEFLELINFSNVFLTDSFHGVVFSIIFEKAFIVYNRVDDGPKMNTRIDTLLEKFSLEDRKHEKLIIENLFTIDYRYVRSILKEEKIKSEEFLLQQLD